MPTTYHVTDIRNVALAGHGASGKTSLADALLFASGATNRKGSVDDGRKHNGRPPKLTADQLRQIEETLQESRNTISSTELLKLLKFNVSARTIRRAKKAIVESDAQSPGHVVGSFLYSWEAGRCAGTEVYRQPRCRTK